MRRMPNTAGVVFLVQDRDSRFFRVVAVSPFFKGHGVNQGDVADIFP